MTTGTRSYGSDGASTFYEYRSWTGADGKYEIVQGSSRLKWNAYSATLISLRGRASDTAPPRLLNITANDSYTAWTGNDTLSLQSRLLMEIRGHDFNLGVALAEGNETVKMVLSTAKALAGCIRSLKRGNFHAAREYLRLGNDAHLLRRLERAKKGVRIDPHIYKGMPSVSSKARNDIAGRWLELQYGWLPLVNDVYEGANAFAVIANRPRVTTVKVSRNRIGLYNASTSPSNWSGWTGVKERRRYFYEMSEDLTTPRSLGLYDPLSIVWEKIPYSFVVDWFIPIGTYLGNLAEIPRLKGRTLTCISVHRYCPTTFQFADVYYKGAWCKRTKLVITRSVSNGLQVAQPHFKPLPAALSKGHIYNAMALISQVV